MPLSHNTHPSILALLHDTESSQDLAVGQSVDQYLQLALQLPESQFEAQLFKAIRLVKDNKWSEACLELCCALRLNPKHEQTLALLIKVVGASDAQAALQLSDGCLDDFPSHPLLWALYWTFAQQLKEEHFIREALNRMPAVTTGYELAAILKLLSSEENVPERIGVCQFNPDTWMVSGWAIDRHDLQQACELVIQSGSFRGQLKADDASSLLKAAGHHTAVGGFQIKLAQASDSLTLTFADGTPLLGSPLAAIAPISFQADPKLQVRFQESAPALEHKRFVSVLVPVYAGCAQTLACLKSVLEAKPQNHVSHEIVVLDDASPDLELTAALEEMAEQGLIKLIRRPANLGFIKNMNRGMLLHPDRDVVWLNADARVMGDWLDRLQRAAYSDPTVASVTPLSNNGELTSFPNIRESSPMPSLREQRSIDQCMAQLNLPPQELFVGCGFCLYLKRAALDEVGLLDEVTLLRGYGEETDWCLRANAKAWRHVAAVNVFVAHSGGESFGREKRNLANRNNALIKRRYPLASDAFDRFVGTDSLKVSRQAIQRARIQTLLLKKTHHKNKNQALVMYRKSVTSGNAGVASIWDIDPEQHPADRVALARAAIRLEWSLRGLDLDVRLILTESCPVIALNYHIPQDIDLLKQELEALAQLIPSGYKVLGSGGVPGALEPCLTHFKKIESVPTRIMTSPKKSSRLIRSTQQLAEYPLQLGALGLIVDDLADPAFAQQWIAAFAKAAEFQASQQCEAQGQAHGQAQAPNPSATLGAFKLLALQDTPAVAQLKKSGVMTLAHFPKGLSIERWLTLFGVSHLVSCTQQESPMFTDAFDRFLVRLQAPQDLEGLPRVCAQTWLKGHDT